MQWIVTTAGSASSALIAPSFTVMRLPPFLGNRASRLIKAPKLYGKWSFDGVKVDDTSLTDHIAIHPIIVPHSAGRFQKKRFRKVKCPIIERLVNGLMFKGRSNGKKLLATRGKSAGKPE